MGKLLVNELGLENSTDTLSRWMAHYISEKIVLLENMPAGDDKSNVERDCYETILKVWEHRWLLPSGNRPLENFEPILKVLDKLNPDKSEPFYWRIFERELRNKEENTSISGQISNYVDTALKIDRVARICIEEILHQAASKAKGKNTENFLKNVAGLSNDVDIKVINILLDSEIKEDAQNIEENAYAEQYRKGKFKEKLEDLQKFSKLLEQIIKEYKDAL